MVQVKVGSFVKTAAAAPVQQVISGLGFRPRSLILWTVGGLVSNTVVPGLFASFGAVGELPGNDPTVPSAPGHIVSTLVDNVGTSQVYGEVFGLHPISTRLISGAPRFRGAVSAFHSDGFTMYWDVNNGASEIIHYIAVGGVEVRTRTVNWVVRAGETGLRPVSNVGFQPDLLLHFYGGPSLYNTQVGIGAAASLGGQWAMSTMSVGESGISNTQRVHVSDACIVNVGSGLLLSTKAVHKSFDPTGFTVNVVDAPGGPVYVVTLCIGGILAKAGTFAKPTAAAPVAQSIPGGFKPSGVILAGTGDPTGTPSAQARLSFGATSAPNDEAAVFFSDRDALDVTDSHAVSHTGRLYMQRDPINGTNLVVADLTGFSQDGFSLNWSQNSGSADLMSCLAIGAREHSLDGRVATIAVTQAGPLRESRHLGAVMKASMRTDNLGKGPIHPLGGVTRAEALTAVAPARVGHRLASAVQTALEVVGDVRQSLVLASTVKSSTITEPVPARAPHILRAAVRAAMATAPVSNSRQHPLAAFVRTEATTDPAPARISHRLGGVVHATAETLGFSRLVLPVVRRAARNEGP